MADLLKVDVKHLITDWNNADDETGFFTGNHPILRMAQEIDNYREHLTTKIDRISELEQLCARITQEARGHAQEARTQRTTVHAIYQALGIQKGDWNGAGPVIKLFKELRASIDQLRDSIDRGPL